MRTEISKKRGRPSQHSKEAREQEAKRGTTSWGVGGEGWWGAESLPNGVQGSGAEPQKNWHF